MRANQFTPVLIALSIACGMAVNFATAKSPVLTAPKPTKNRSTITPDPQNLVSAFRAQNSSLLNRIGQRMGSYGVAKQVENPDRVTALAAISASGGPDDRWSLLPTLAAAAAHPDRTVAIAAAEAGSVLSADIDQMLLEEHEITNFELGTWQNAWLQVAAQPQRWMDIRVFSFEVAADLYFLQPISKRAPLDWDKFLEDSNPTMRAAAINRLPFSHRLQPQITAILQNDPSPRVSLRAGQWLCGPLGGGPNSGNSLSKNPLGKKEERSEIDLDAKSTERLIELMTSTVHSIARRSDLASCLIHDASPESRRALKALIQQSSPSLRKVLKFELRGE